MKPQTFVAGRRDFLIKTAAVSGGLAVGVNLSGNVLAADAAAIPEVTHWIVIQPNDIVVIRIARSELGQGSFTGLAQLVAEELECDWSKVRPEYADVNDHIKRKTYSKNGFHNSKQFNWNETSTRIGNILQSTLIEFSRTVGELEVAR